MRSPFAKLGRRRKSLPLLASEHQFESDELHFLEFTQMLLPSHQFSCGHLSCCPLDDSGPTFSLMLNYPSNPPHMQSNFSSLDLHSLPIGKPLDRLFLGPFSAHVVILTNFHVTSSPAPQDLTVKTLWFSCYGASWHNFHAQATAGSPPLLPVHVWHTKSCRWSSTATSHLHLLLIGNSL